MTAATIPTAVTPAVTGFVLELRSVADPLTRTHGVTRSPEYRLRLLLKRLLRDFGFRCVSVRDVPGPADLTIEGGVECTT